MMYNSRENRRETLSGCTGHGKIQDLVPNYCTPE